ncbi:MAG: cytochrome c [Chloroflexi bacterium]|nr:MAG: cytochrome c [Chloroflexota bacterium]
MRRGYIAILLAFVSGIIIGSIATFVIVGNNPSKDTTIIASTDAPAPEAVNVGDLFDGKTVEEFYMETCGGCHGMQREGEIGPALLPEVLTAPREFYFDTVKNGRNGTRMPPWGQFGLSDEQIDALVEFILTEPV